MYIICTYDVNSKRCSIVMKVLKKYFYHVQRSVFEGDISPKLYEHLEDELNEIIKEEDEVVMYILNTDRRPNTTRIGKQISAHPNAII